MLQLWNRAPAQTRGIVLACIATLIFSLMNATAKGLTHDYPPMQVVWARYTSQTFWVFLILSPWLAQYLRTSNLMVQLIRSALLFCATFFLYSSFKFLGLAEAFAISEIYPLIIVVLSVLFLKERVSPAIWVSVMIGLAGALVIIRPGTAVFQLASLMPAIAALSFAGYMVFTRVLGARDDPRTTLLYTALIGTIGASVLVYPYWTAPSQNAVLAMAVLGFGAGVGHLMVIYAMTIVNASTLAPFAYLGLVFNGLWGFIFFGDRPDIPTYLGAFMIVSAGLYVWHRQSKL